MPIPIPWPRRPAPGTLLLAALIALGAPPRALPAQEQGIDDVAAREVGMTAASGLVVAIHFRGSLALLRAYGSPGHADAVPLPPDALFAFPAFVETLAGAAALVLAGRGVVELDAPVGRYAPELPVPLRRATLRQLLSHTAGLDDAEPGEEGAPLWEGISERTAFTEPGMVYSRSRYDVPLAIRVLENATDTPFAELVGRLLLEPLSMERSTFDLDEARAAGLLQGYVMGNLADRPVEPVPLDGAGGDGLPIFFTTASDLARFAGAWMSGLIAGARELPAPAEGVLYPRGSRRYALGISVGRFQELPDLVQSGSWKGFGAVVRFLPGQRLAVVALGNGGAEPWRPANFALARIVDELRAASGMEGPPAFAEDPGEGEGEDPLPGALADLAGSYVNGDRLVVLRARGDSLLYFDGTRELAVRHRGGAVFSAHVEDGREAVRFQVGRDREGRLYVFRGGRAFLRTEGVTPAGG